MFFLSRISGWDFVFIFRTVQLTDFVNEKDMFGFFRLIAMQLQARPSAIGRIIRGWLLKKKACETSRYQ